MVEEPDVRVDGLSHAQIVEWARQGTAGESTHVLEGRMQSIIDALRFAADEVNDAVQKTKSGDWEGATAQTASAAMAILRDFDETLHNHGTADRNSAMGQSGESAATRSRVPPIPLHLDAQPTILGSTVDPKFRIDARREAEQQARLVLAEYQEATRHRLVNLPQIAPVPAIVLDTSTDEPGSSGPSGSAPRRAKPAASVRVPAQTTSGGKQVAPKAGASARSTTKPVESPGQVAEPAAYPTAPQAMGQTPASGVARGDPVTSGSPIATAVVGGIAAVPTGGAPTVGEPEVLGGGEQWPGEAPRTGAAQRAVERQAVVRRELGSPRVGPNGVVGGAAGAPGQEEEEHQNRYRVPSGEPFDAEEVEYDGEFLVAPDVIGGPE